MRILSLNLAIVETMQLGGRTVETGFFKKPVADRAVVEETGLKGDFRGTSRSVGDHAICVYPNEHYDRFERDLGRKLQPGSFGENLTVGGALESQVRIGDIFEGREVRLQLAGPRTPCKKLNIALGARFSGTFLESTHVGYYLRVLTPGLLFCGERLSITNLRADNPTVEDFVRDCLLEYWEPETLQAFRRSPGLSSEWHEVLDQKTRRARAAKGWAGLRSFSIVSCIDTSEGQRLRLECSRKRSLPILRQSQSLGLLYRKGPFEAPQRFRSVPQGDARGAHVIGPEAYELTFSGLPKDAVSRGWVRLSAPQG